MHYWDLLSLSYLLFIRLHTFFVTVVDFYYNKQISAVFISLYVGHITAVLDLDHFTLRPDPGFQS